MAELGAHVQGPTEHRQEGAYQQVVGAGEGMMGADAKDYCANVTILQIRT